MSPSPLLKPKPKPKPKLKPKPYPNPNPIPIPALTIGEPLSSPQAFEPTDVSIRS